MGYSDSRRASTRSLYTDNGMSVVLSNLAYLPFAGVLADGITAHGELSYVYGVWCTEYGVDQISIHLGLPKTTASNRMNRLMTCTLLQTVAIVDNAIGTSLLFNTENPTAA